MQSSRSSLLFLLFLRSLKDAYLDFLLSNSCYDCRCLFIFFSSFTLNLCTFLESGSCVLVVYLLLFGENSLFVIGILTKRELVDLSCFEAAVDFLLLKYCCDIFLTPSLCFFLWLTADCGLSLGWIVFISMPKRLGLGICTKTPWDSIEGDKRNPFSGLIDFFFATFYKNLLFLECYFAAWLEYSPIYVWALYCFNYSLLTPN